MDPKDCNVIEEEVEILKAIYGEEFQTLEPTQTRFAYQISIPIKENNQIVKLSFSLPDGYPNASIPRFELSSKWLNPTQQIQLSNRLKEMYFECEPKQQIIFQWTEWIRENAFSFLHLNDSSQNNSRSEETNTQHPRRVHILHEAPIKDRKSKFQAHIAEVSSVEEVNIVIEELMTNKKIREATHNMYAYRIRRLAQDPIQEESKDDGETGAGSQILFVLQQMNVVNVVVVVTRWYGGVDLGPDRFKHITNQTKSIVQHYLKNKQIQEEEIESNRQKCQKNRFRPEIDVMNRIKHDPNMNCDEFVVGYEDRFNGIEEVSIKEFESHEIPLHRIRYFKRLGQIVWDRTKKIDKIFGSGNEQK